MMKEKKDRLFYKSKIKILASGTRPELVAMYNDLTVPYPGGVPNADYVNKVRFDRPFLDAYVIFFNRNTGNLSPTRQLVDAYGGFLHRIQLFINSASAVLRDNIDLSDYFNAAGLYTINWVSPVDDILASLESNYGVGEMFDIIVTYIEQN